MKRLRSQVKTCIQDKTTATVVKNHCHSFESEREIGNLRTKLFNWYDVNKRDLQWRDLAQHNDPNIRGYSGISLATRLFGYSKYRK